MIVCTAAVACLLAPASPLAGAGKPLVSLVATPAHVALAGRSRQTVRLRNGGTERLVVDATRAGFALDPRGRPKIVAGRAVRLASSWIVVRPTSLVIPAGQTRRLTIVSRVPPRAEPGDHHALVLVTSRPRRRGAVFVRMRLGVVVVIRAPGRIVRRLTPVRLHVRRSARGRLLELLVANRGNVTESVSRACIGLSLYRGRRRVAVLGPSPRQLLPRTNGIVEFRYRGRGRGVFQARIDGTGRRKLCPAVSAHLFRVRL